MTSYLDLSGLLLVQSNYLNSLNTGNDADQAKLTDIHDKLKILNDNYNSANTSSAQVLTNQDKVNDIVLAEKKRLELKKNDIDTAMDGQNRAVLLNNSFRKRYQEYTKMVIVVVITLVVFIGLVLLGRLLPIIPSFIIDLSCIIVITIGIIVCYLIYVNILARDKVNFDELNLSNPVILSASDIAKSTAAAQASGNLLGSINLGYCVGAACCSDASGTVWDMSQSMCVVKPAVTTSVASDASKAPFTSIFVSQIEGDFKKKIINANSPNEFEQYARI